MSSPGPVGMTSLVVGDKTDKVEAMDLDPPASVTSPVKRNRTTSSANYESSPAQILTSLQTVMSVSLPGSEPVTPAGTISCPQVSLLASHRDQNMCSKDTALVNEIFFCEVRI